MSRGTFGTGEVDFLQAWVKRGFVNIPRMLFDYTADLGLDYDTIGKMYAILACVGGSGESAFGAYTISRKANPEYFDQLRLLIVDLEQKDLVRSEDEGEQIIFSLIPLFSRLRAIWEHYREQYEEEVAAGGVSDPSLLAAERLLGRPLSDREVLDIQDWSSTFAFDTEMVQAVIREGQRLGVTRMSYLNQIAKQWFEEGVRTPDEAEAYVQRYRRASGKHKAIIQYLGLKRQLTGAEQGLLDRWTDEWGFSNEVIIRAGEEAAGSRNPLQYINRVLESWQQQGVKSLSDVDQVLVEHKRRSSPAEPAAENRSRRPPSKSNVFLQREKKDDKYYDHIYKKFSD
ncbi:MAG: putative chromosome replication initiation protein [Firmicutes bacterium]|nr:putative chromosome replication initiation protein [Bacillota bacterium]